MSKFTCFVLCAVGLTLNSVFVDGDGSCRESFKPFEQECLKELGLSNDDLEASMKAQDVGLIDACFYGCLFKKIGLLNDKGQYDLDAGLAGLKKMTTNDMIFAKLKNSAEQCKTVQDKPVSDGEAGCEIGALVAACFLEKAH